VAVFRSTDNRVTMYPSQATRHFPFIYIYKKKEKRKKKEDISETGL